MAGFHYYTGLSGSNDVDLGFVLGNDSILRWNVTNLGRSWEASPNRQQRVGWYCITDGPISGDPTLPDGRYYGEIMWMQHLKGEGSLLGVTIDGGITEIHVEVMSGVVLDIAVYGP